MKKKLKLTFILLTVVLLINNITFAYVDNSCICYIATETTSKIENSTEEDDLPVDSLDLYAESAILVETSTERIAYEKNIDKKMYPASITKILTAILAVENCNMDDTVTITYDMISKIPSGYTTAYLRVGENLTVEQLLNTLLIPSANDSGFALAIHISGSVEAFAELMNQKATEIGCTNSHFTNPSGIHDDNHYTTARDMAIIALYAMQYPQITEIGAKTSYTLSPPNSNTRTFKTTNTLITPSAECYYEYATGLKTGFTDYAGACLIATAQKDNAQFLAVILNAPSAKGNTVFRDEDSKKLFEYGFENYNKIVTYEMLFSKFNNTYKLNVSEPEQTPTIPSTPNSSNLHIILQVSLIIIGLYILLIIIKKRSK